MSDAGTHALQHMEKPAAGATVFLPVQAGHTYVASFTPEEASVEASGADLLFTFADKSTLILQGFSEATKADDVFLDFQGSLLSGRELTRVLLESPDFNTNTGAASFPLPLGEELAPLPFGEEPYSQGTIIFPLSSTPPALHLEDLLDTSPKVLTQARGTTNTLWFDLAATQPVTAASAPPPEHPLQTDAPHTPGELLPFFWLEQG